MKILLIISLVLTMAFAVVEAENAKQISSNDLLQYKSEGHVIAFTQKCVYLTALDHMLNIEFVGGSGVPIESNYNDLFKKESNHDISFIVKYEKLWDDVDVVYEKDNHSIVKVSYYAKDEKSVDNIHLKYNRETLVRPDGSLEIFYKTGRLIENAPVAWQIINGRKEFIEVSFNQKKSKEIGFNVGPHDKYHPIIIDPSITWHTFIGGMGADYGNNLSLDDEGNVYISGYSNADWGTPVRGYSGKTDAIVVKLNSSGNLIWHTFLGGKIKDIGRSIIATGDGSVYVTGESSADWGNPIKPFTTGDNVFVAKLNPNGQLIWNTFISNRAYDIALNDHGEVYICGESFSNWGTPINNFSSGRDILVAKFSQSGTLLWHTFLGGIFDEKASSIEVDDQDNIFISGWCTGTFGNPVNSFSGKNDVIAAKLNPSGVLQWHTYVGGPELDLASGVDIDENGNVYITGWCNSSWGSPVNAYSGNDEILVAKLNNSGLLQWHTFIGGTDNDASYSIDLDNKDNVFISGYSYGNWGNPINPYSAGRDATIIALKRTGELKWHTFFGGASDESGRGITADNRGNILVAGNAMGTSGSPINDFVGKSDLLAIKYKAIDIDDCRCGKKLDKIEICHKGKTLCISPSALEAHLAHGDYLGPCFAKKADYDDMDDLINNWEGEENISIRLKPNNPNPFSDLTEIQYFLTKNDKVKLSLVDINGKVIANLIDRNVNGGWHTLIVNGSGLSSGVYMLRMDAGGQSTTMLINKIN